MRYLPNVYYTLSWSVGHLVQFTFIAQKKIYYVVCVLVLHITHLCPGFWDTLSIHCAFIAQMYIYSIVCVPAFGTTCTFKYLSLCPALWDTLYICSVYLSIES